MKKKIHVKARKMLYDGIGDLVWASGSGGGKVRGSRKKGYRQPSAGEKGKQKDESDSSGHVARRSS